MAYIEKTTFEIYQQQTTEECFECDDIIAPVIRVLNLKGYKTTFCCSGHPFMDQNEFIAINQTPEELQEFIDGIYEIKEISRDELDSLYPVDDIPLDAKIYCVKFRNSTNRIDSYIAFEEGYLPDILPDGWEEEDSCIRIFFDNQYDTEYDFFEEQLECMKNLKKWADDLPKKKC